MRKKLTPSAKRRITQDWNLCFPDLAIYKPMWLLRRAGAILVGICLDRDSGNMSYTPTFHIHNLCKEFVTIALTLAVRQCRAPSKGPNSIYVDGHEEAYEKAAGLLRKQALLPIEGEVSFQQVIGAYEKWGSGPFGITMPPHYEDLASLRSWAGHPDKARQAVAEGMKLVRKWPEQKIDICGGLDVLNEQLRRHLQSREKIEEIIASEIEKHGLQNLPASELVM